MAEFDHETFKEVLKRVSGNKKNKEIADQLHVSEPKISRWFNGSAIPSTTDLLVIAETYGCSVDELLGLASLRDGAKYTFGDFIRIVHELYTNDKVDILPVDGIYIPWADFVSMKRISDSTVSVEAKNTTCWTDLVDPETPDGLTLDEAQELEESALDMGNQFSDYVMTFKGFSLETLFDIEDYHQIIKADTYHGTSDRLLQAWFKSVKDKPLGEF